MKDQMNILKKKRLIDNVFVINASMKQRLYQALKGNIKNIKYLDYSPEDLRNHLEKLFKPWMSWDNYGKGAEKWCIDHIRPISSFTFSSYEDEEFKECWQLKNLRPLGFIANSKKNKKYDNIKINLP